MDHLTTSAGKSLKTKPSVTISRRAGSHSHPHCQNQILRLRKRIREEAPFNAAHGPNSISSGISHRDTASLIILPHTPSNQMQTNVIHNVGKQREGNEIAQPEDMTVTRWWWCARGGGHPVRPCLISTRISLPSGPLFFLTRALSLQCYYSGSSASVAVCI